MQTDLKSLLHQWHYRKTETEWVLGTVYKTQGSAYRKAGAMMLINGMGEQFGLLSGGCLEADIMLKAKKVMRTGKALTHCYDATDEDDLSYQLGIGCGGKVYIMLQPVTTDNDLGLEEVFKALQARKNGIFYQRIPTRTGQAEARFEAGDIIDNKTNIIQDEAGQNWFTSPIRTMPHLMIVGGGMDARPLFEQARSLGWSVSLCDPRAANARPEHFQGAEAVIRSTNEELNRYIDEAKVNAVVLMSHSTKIDAQALKTIQSNRLEYLALLGPKHRSEEILAKAGLSYNQLSCPIFSPAGLDIGGEGPASIALSIMAQCHGVLYGKMAKSLSQMVA